MGPWRWWGWAARPVPAAAGDLVITDKNKGQAFTVKVGQKISVNLRNPGGGGYNFLAPEFDKSILKMVGEKRHPPVGAPADGGFRPYGV
jgi:hypothetical protein